MARRDDSVLQLPMIWKCRIANHLKYLSLVGLFSGCTVIAPVDPIDESETTTSGGSMAGSGGGSSGGTPDAAGAECDEVELLRDRSFDEHLDVWMEESSNMEDLVREVGRLGIVNRAQSGNWAAWLGGKENEVSILSQGIVVPRYTEELTISGYYGIINPDAGDPGVITLQDGEGVTVATWTPPQAVVPWEPFELTVDVRDHNNIQMAFMLGFSTDAVDPVASLYFDTLSLVATICE
jgi:hypothetical protein